ncbi:MAG: heat-inducible transcriptional repressor HrcA [Rhodothermaceae bacterium]|nr:heat-inducible transcriptional repressor HrcA [Rhodothermaceae bacterium]
MQSRHKTYKENLGRTLTERESMVLGLVVRSFIETAGPIGSKFLVDTYSMGLSSASIRNTMNDLEQLGYLGHPHTSAGRVPTDLGYRQFVDELMEPFPLSKNDKQLLKDQLGLAFQEPLVVLRECSRLLGQLSNLLGVVLSPRLSTGVLERLELVPLSSSRVMFVISLKGRLVKTVVLEMASELTRDELDRVVRLLNERLAGLTLEEIRNSFAQRMKDVTDEPTGIVRLVLSTSHTFFSEPAEERVSLAGTQNIMVQPEFLSEPEELKRLVGMLEDANFIVHLLEEESEQSGRASVRIGSENSASMVDKYSIVTANYTFGNIVGTLGIIGPKRMNYARVVSLVEGAAALLTHTDPSIHRYD